jgi:hypothetical protein
MSKAKKMTCVPAEGIETQLAFIVEGYRLTFRTVPTLMKSIRSRDTRGHVLMRSFPLRDNSGRHGRRGSPGLDIILLEFVKALILFVSMRRAQPCTSLKGNVPPAGERATK